MPRTRCPDIPRPRFADGSPIVSKRSSRRLNTTFLNRCDAPVSLRWIDFDGAPVFYQTLSPGDRALFYTFRQHPWFFTYAPSPTPAPDSRFIYVEEQGKRVAFPTKKHPVLTLKVAKPATWTHKSHRALFTEQPAFLAQVETLLRVHNRLRRHPELQLLQEREMPATCTNVLSSVLKSLWSMCATCAWHPAHEHGAAGNEDEEALLPPTAVPHTEQQHPASAAEPAAAAAAAAAAGTASVPTAAQLHAPAQQAACERGQGHPPAAVSQGLAGQEDVYAAVHGVSGSGSSRVLHGGGIPGHTAAPTDAADQPSERRRRTDLGDLPSELILEVISRFAPDVPDVLPITPEDMQSEEGEDEEEWGWEVPDGMAPGQPPPGALGEEEEEEEEEQGGGDDGDESDSDGGEAEGGGGQASMSDEDGVAGVGEDSQMDSNNLGSEAVAAAAAAAAAAPLQGMEGMAEDVIEEAEIQWSQEAASFGNEE